MTGTVDDGVGVVVGVVVDVRVTVGVAVAVTAAVVVAVAVGVVTGWFSFHACSNWRRASGGFCGAVFPFWSNSLSP